MVKPVIFFNRYFKTFGMVPPLTGGTKKTVLVTFNQFIACTTWEFVVRARIDFDVSG